MSVVRRLREHWTTVVPVLALVALVVSWGQKLPPVGSAVVALVIVGTVLSAVHHAEVVAHKVGEPFGSLVLAVAVTIIEVGLIVTLMVSGGGETATLARDTVFAAVMITLNGIVGISILVNVRRHTFSNFNAEGTGAALATVIVLAVTCLVLPSVTTSAKGPQFSPSQLAFAGVASLVLYVVFVVTQATRHRDFFLPVDSAGQPLTDDDHAAPPSGRRALVSVGLLLVALVGVVGLAKVESPVIESAVASAGLPAGVVGTVIALLVLAPETLAAVNNARRDRVQTSFNLALGSAMASVGLTIPVLGVATIWLDSPLYLGLDTTQTVLLAMTAIVAVLTVVPARATRLNGMVHLVVLLAYVFLVANP